MKNNEPQDIAILEAVCQLTQEGHTVTLPLRGRSMRPFLEDRRDKALLKKVDNPQVGDPVFARFSKERFILHRIIKIEGDLVTMMGDGNLTTEQCRLDQIKCSVIGFYRKGRDTLDPIDGWKWKLYSKIWMRLTPARRYLLMFYNHIWIKIFPSKYTF